MMKKKRLKKRVVVPSSSDDDDSDDVDSRGNIRGLIAYSDDEIEPPAKTLLPRPRKIAVSSASLRRGRLVRSKSSASQRNHDAMRRRHDEPVNAEPVGTGLANMLLMSHLCEHMSGVANARRRRLRRKRRRVARKKRASDTEDATDDETSDDDNDNDDDSDDDSDSDWIDGETSDDDLEETLTGTERKYFKSLDKKRRCELVEEYDMLKLSEKQEVPLKFRILTMKKLSEQSRSFLLSRLKNYQNMEPGSNEFYKLNSWFKNFDKLPFESNASAIIPVQSGSRKIYNFLQKSRETLDAAVHGHDAVKDEVVQLIATWISNKHGSGQVLALQGPPGNGKTTLVKHGLAKVLQRPFALIQLGGAKDSAFLQGHEYTFEGSKPGKIFEVLRDTGSMAPLIFFDEIDKISDTPSGREISNLLCHILDPVQNSHFQDRYLSGIDLDLSKAVFVLSFNDESAIDPILKDRMRVIRMRGFKMNEKIDIASKFLLPAIFREIKFKPSNAIFSDEILRFIVEKYTKEDGVRDLRRCLESLVTKLNVLKLIGKKSPAKISKIVKFSAVGISFPVVVTEDIVVALMRKDTKFNGIASMYL